MINTNEIFQRIEKKYLLNASVYEAFKKELEQHMKVDAYGLSTICNIYYDTNQDDLIRRSIAKPVYKEKLRLRSYGIPDASHKSFVEIKKKYSGVVYKRRIEMPYEQACNYLNHGIKSGTDSQIRHEIDYFMKYYEPIPKMFIGYDRIAMAGIEDAGVRLTFDQNIRFRTDRLDLSLGDDGELLLQPGQVLMEIKVPGAYPLWMSHLLDEFKIYPISYSKYGMAYMRKFHRENEAPRDDVSALGSEKTGRKLGSEESCRESEGEKSSCESSRAINRKNRKAS